MLSILGMTILYIILYYKGVSKPLFNIELHPLEWWIYTGWITSFLGLYSWWAMINNYGIWKATAITYVLHTVVEMGLNFYYFDAPTTQQYIGLALLSLGCFLVIK